MVREYTFYYFSPFNLLKFVLWPSVWPVLCLVHLRRMDFLLLLCRVFYRYLLRLFGFTVLFKPFISLLIFCQVVLCIIDSGILMSPAIVLLFFLKFIYFWLCWVFVSVRGLSPAAASGGHSSSRCAGLSLLWPLLLRSTGSRRAGSVIVAHGPSCSAACGIFLDQGSNPCPLHWQADSQPLRHQGSPYIGLLIAHYWFSSFEFFLWIEVTIYSHFLISPIQFYSRSLLCAIIGKYITFLCYRPNNTIIYIYLELYIFLIFKYMYSFIQLLFKPVEKTGKHIAFVVFFVIT